MWLHLRYPLHLVRKSNVCQSDIQGYNKRLRGLGYRPDRPIWGCYQGQGDDLYNGRWCDGSAAGQKGALMALVLLHRLGCDWLFSCFSPSSLSVWFRTPGFLLSYPFLWMFCLLLSLKTASTEPAGLTSVIGQGRLYLVFPFFDRGIGRRPFGEVFCSHFAYKGSPYFFNKATMRHLSVSQNALARQGPLPHGFPRKIHPHFVSVIFPEIFGNGMLAFVTQSQKLSLTL